jgi:hypothetical protein
MLVHQAKERVRRKLLVRYDRAAERHEFTHDGHWASWQPDEAASVSNLRTVTRDRAPSALLGATIGLALIVSAAWIGFLGYLLFTLIT